MKDKIERFKNEKIAINTKTQEEYNELMKLLEKEGLRWKFNVKSTEIILWHIYKNETCITYDYSGDLMLEYCSKKFYKENGYEIISYQDFVQPKQFTKSDLKERWLVKLKNGEEAFLFEDTLYFIKNGKFTNSTIELDDYKNDLTCKIKSYEEYDIIEIYKPHYEKVWTREEETKEMTVAEIEKELGYKIKIVKGEK